MNSDLPQPETTVVVVSYCTRELLCDCLTSLREQADGYTELIVVDNHSTDDSVAMLRREFPEVKLLENSENAGFARANNQGIREARGLYILLLNSDTVVRPEAVQTMAHFMRTHSEAGAIGCRLLYPDGRIQATAGRHASPNLLGLILRLSGLAHAIRSNRARRTLRRYVGFLLGPSLRSYLDPYAASAAPFEVETISGACLMVRREAVAQVGELDENFFMYLEDLDYCLRLGACGWKLYYVPSAEVVHFVGSSSGGRMREYSVRSYQSLLHFYRKHYPAWTKWVRLTILILLLPRWLFSAICQSFSRNPLHCQNREGLAQIIRLCLAGDARAPRESEAPIQPRRSCAVQAIQEDRLCEENSRPN
jgi:GT2 family glycosyltransferase